MNVYISDIPDGMNYTRLVIILPKRSIERTWIIRIALVAFGTRVCVVRSRLNEYYSTVSIW